MAAFYPWWLSKCTDPRYTTRVTCEEFHFAAPVQGLGAMPVVALVVAALLGVLAVWRPTKRSWNGVGWAGLVAGVVGFALLGIDRQVRLLDSTHQNWAPVVYDAGTAILAITGLAVMMTGRHLGSERLPHAHAHARMST